MAVKFKKSSENKRFGAIVDKNTLSRSYDVGVWFVAQSLDIGFLI